MFCKQRSIQVTNLKCGIYIPIFITVFLFSIRATAQEIPKEVEKLPVTEVPQDERIYEMVFIQNKPEYPGGLNKFRQYIANNIRYPASAIRAGIQGTVNVLFTVEKDGSRVDFKVEKRIGGGLDEEALKVVKKGGNWMPGLLKGFLSE